MKMVFRFRARWEDWVPLARRGIQQSIPPSELIWISDEHPQEEMVFSTDPTSDRCPTPIRIPKEFLFLGQTVVAHTDPQRWSLLYQLLWRLTHGEKNLLSIRVDPLVHAIRSLEKKVHREIHKMRAFVRFTKSEIEKETWYVAWFEPQYRVLSLNAPFFKNRFHSMNWSILSPLESVHWNQKELMIGEGTLRPESLGEDPLVDLWIHYYRNIFNPARVKIGAMKKEMPEYYWRNLPESQAISDLLLKSTDRVDQMKEKSV